MWNIISFISSKDPTDVVLGDQVKSTVPFSEPFVIDPSNPPPEKDYEVYFKELKDGITGKEALEGTPALVWRQCRM